MIACAGHEITLVRIERHSIVMIIHCLTKFSKVWEKSSISAETLKRSAIQSWWFLQPEITSIYKSLVESILLKILHFWNSLIFHMKRLYWFSELWHDSNITKCSTLIKRIYTIHAIFCNKCYKREGTLGNSLADIKISIFYSD